MICIKHLQTISTISICACNRETVSGRLTHYDADESFADYRAFCLGTSQTLRAVQPRRLVNIEADQEASNKGDDDKEDAEAPCGQPLNSCQARFSLERLKDVYKMKEAVLQSFAWMLIGQNKGGHSASASRWHDIYLLCLQEKDEMDAFLHDIKDVEDKASPQLKRSVVGTVKV